MDAPSSRKYAKAPESVAAHNYIAVMPTNLYGPNDNLEEVFENRDKHRRRCAPRNL